MHTDWLDTCGSSGAAALTASASTPRLDETTGSSFLRLTALSTSKKSRRLEGSCSLGLHGWQQIKPQKQGNNTDSEQLLPGLPHILPHTYCGSGFRLDRGLESSGKEPHRKQNQDSGKGGSQTVQ